MLGGKHQLDVWHIPLILALNRQKQATLLSLKVSLVYKVSEL